MVIDDCCFSKRAYLCILQRKKCQTLLEPLPDESNDLQVKKNVYCHWDGSANVLLAELEKSVLGKEAATRTMYMQ
jgi:hypothetical protein